MNLPFWNDPNSPVHNRNYRLFLVGAFVSNIGTWMEGVAMGWTVLQLGNSAVLLGLLGFLQTVPTLLLGIVAGGLVDRVDRRKILLVTQSVAAMLATILAVVQGTGHASIPALLVIAACSGIINTVTGPAWQAFTKELVGPEQLRQAIALGSARFNLSRILGPAIGGGLLVAFGATACFAVNALSFLAVLAALAAIRGAGTPEVFARHAGIAGLLTVARHPHVRSVLVPAVGLTLLLMPYGSFLPAMARDVFHAGAAGLSALLTGTGAGALVGSFVSGLPLVAHRPKRVLALFQVVAGLAFAGFALSPVFPVAVACLIVFGGGVTAYLATAGATLQLAAEPGTEGRVLALWMMASAGLIPIGSLLIGGATTVMTLRDALAAAGGLSAVAGLLSGSLTLRAWFRARRMAHPEQLTTVQAP